MPAHYIYLYVYLYIYILLLVNAMTRQSQVPSTILLLCHLGMTYDSTRWQEIRTWYFVLLLCTPL